MDNKPKRWSREWIKVEIISWIKTIATSLAIVLIIHTFLFTIIRVDGKSMNETLYTNDRLFVSVLDVKFGQGAEQFDVVICKYPDSKDYFVKRVVGLPGDVIRITDGITYVNEVAIIEDFVTHKKRENFGPFTVSAGHYFVMGDNRANSRDSRSSSVGEIPKDQIIGIAKAIIWPPVHMRAIEN